MNYFEFYGIDLAFEIDQSILKKQFLSKSKELHPDFHSLESEGVQEKMLEQSAFNNLAYKTLKSKTKRYRYLLEVLGISFEEGKDKMSPDFLMEMMELNELVMNLEFDFSEKKYNEALKTIDQKYEALEHANMELIQKLENFNISIKSNELSLYLGEVKSYLFKVKYLDRLRENLKKQKTQ